MYMNTFYWHVATGGGVGAAPSTFIKKYFSPIFFSRKSNTRVIWPLEFCRYPFCIFVYWRWTNSFLFRPFSYIHIIITKINIKAHCIPPPPPPPFVHTFNTVSKWILANIGLLNKILITRYDIDKLFRIPHFSPTDQECDVVQK